MKKLFLIYILSPLMVFAQDSTRTEKALKVVPLITSSPLLGLGVGSSSSYLYDTDGGLSS